jgi:transposase
MLALVSPDSMVPENHILRRIKPIVDAILRDMSPTFDAMYATSGRTSVPPERLLKGTLLMAFFSVRSERALCEQIGYNMLFRWFLDMDMMEKPFDPTVFTHNRDRLLAHDVSTAFLAAVVERARNEGWLSSDHFSVDGTLIQSWASMKSFRPKDDDSDDNNGFGDFKGTKRTNETHESKADPDANLFRKGRGQEAKLCYMGHALMENRNGLVVDLELTEASGRAERQAAIRMLARERKKRDTRCPRRVTVAADRAYDTRDFVAECRQMRVTPHVAGCTHRRPAIDARTTHHAGYAMSSRARMLIEKIFGWKKTIGGMRRSRFRGRPKTEFAAKIIAAAFNILRMTNLRAAPT